MSISIRPATIEDLPRIVAIYNQAILQKGLTADLDIQQVENKINWFESHHPEQYPLFVATLQNDIIGWVSLSPYREGRRALKRTVEVSLYLDEKHIGKGIGTYLMQHILAEAIQLGYRNMVAILIADNEKSVGLFSKFNFTLWGTLPGIVEVEERRLNHCIYGRDLFETEL